MADMMRAGLLGTRSKTRQLPRWSAWVPALGLFVLDGLVMGQGWLAAVALLAVGIWLLPKAWLIHSLDRDARPLWRLCGSIGLSAVATLTFINFNNELARQRAAEVIGAVELFRAVAGRYPRDLPELVPTYLAAVPRAKFTLTYGDYVYTADERNARLSYIDVAPLGLRAYDFASQRWGDAALSGRLVSVNHAR